MHDFQRAEAVQQEEAARQRQQEEHLGALVAKVHSAREAVERSAVELQAASVELKNAIRRSLDDSTASYLVFVNAHVRLAGALTQGVKRTAAMDNFLGRRLERVKQERQERQVAAEKAEERRQKRHQAAVSESSWDAFDDVYGEITGGMSHVD